MAEATALITVAPRSVPARFASRVWRMRRLPLIPMFILAVFVFTGITANWIAPHNPERGDIRARNLPPAWLEGGSTKYLLGSDHLGRDSLSRIIFGARISLIVVAVTLGRLPGSRPRAFAQVWGAYPIEDMESLRAGEYEVAHGGYDNRPVEQDPHRLVPVDVLRQMERDGLVGKLHPEFLSTTGNSNPLENSRRMGREMAARLIEAGVDSVILTST